MTVDLSPAASLEEILDAREQRVIQRRRLVREHAGRTIICFTLNIAGPHKTFSLAERTFFKGMRLIEAGLSRSGTDFILCGHSCEKTGYAAFYAVQLPPIELKRRMCAIEDGSALGRLFDIDVYREDGEKVSRIDFGLPERVCILCGNPAPVCARSRAHGLEQLTERILTIMREYFDCAFADRMAGFAVRALMYEVAVTPKPGLVDRSNNGAHSDMDVFTFIDSASALFPCFRKFVMQGIQAKQGLESLFCDIRETGRQAEAMMFETTNGVNTHKGAIFSFGLIMAACGLLEGKGEPLTVGGVVEIASRMAAFSLKDFNRVSAENAATAGEKAYLEHGSRGIRGEAAGGFQSVMDYSLPTLRRLSEQGCGRNEAGVAALLALIANVWDTNIVHRAGFDALRDIRQRVGKLLEEDLSPTQLAERAAELDREFIALNISAGGCADLLAATWLLFFIETESRE